MKLMLQDIGPWFALLLFGFLPNEIWRLAGFVLVRGLDEKSPVITWVRAVATAMLAGVPMKPPASEKEKPDVLADHASKLAAALKG